MIVDCGPSAGRNGDGAGPRLRRHGRLVPRRARPDRQMVRAGRVLRAGCPRGRPDAGLATDHADRIPERPGVGWTPNFSVDDFDETVAALRAAGVVFDADEEGAD